MKEVHIGQQKCLANDRCEMIQLSSKFLRLIGYSLQELQELFAGSYYPLIVPEDRQLVWQILHELTPEHPDYVVDYRVQRKNGRILWIHEQGSLVCENGVDYYYCEMSDATLYYQRERFYINVLSSLPNPVFVLDMDLRINFINNAAKQMLGASESEWIGRPCRDMKSPLCGTEDCCVKRFLRGESPAIQHTAEGGYNRVTIAPLYGEDGEQAGYISVSTDVTELMQAQQDLQLGEERYRIAINQTQDAIWELDIAGSTLYYPGVSTHYNLPHVLAGVPQTLIDRGFIHPDSVQDVQEMYRRITAGEQSLSYEIRTCDKNDAFRWIRLTSTTLFDDGGQAVRAIGTSRDITQEKELEACFLRERQYRDSLASDAMHAYEVNLTKDELLHLDDEWIKTFGLIRTKSYSDFLEDVAQTAVHPEDRQYMAAVHSRQSLLDIFSRGKREFHCEYRRKNESGRMIWVRSSIFLILSPEGDVCCFVYLKDIDEEKEAELTLRRKAERDSLTGLYNRDAVLTLAQTALQEDHSGLCAVIMLDVDDFKQINDTFGHLYGDAVLSETAEKLSTVFRKDDIIGRIGGDEFVVFLKGLPNEETAHRKCEQLLSQLASVYSSGDRECKISVSVGLAFAPRHGTTFVQLYQKADIALYHAKNSGKHRLSVYAQAMSAPHKPKTPTKMERHLAKSFSQNIVEYVFKILYNASDLERSILPVLELMCKHFHCRHGYILERNRQTEEFSMTFEWCAQGEKALRGSMRRITPGDWGGSLMLLEKEGLLSLSGSAHANHLLQEIANRLGAQDLLQCPILIGGRLYGFIGVDTDAPSHRFSSGDSEMFQSACEIIGTFLSGKRNEQKRERYACSLQTVLDHLEHAAYVVNPKDHRLIYLNRKTDQFFPSAQVGDRCYQALLNSPVPCAFCPILHLDSAPEENPSAVLRAPDTGSWLEASVSRVDWPDGGSYCLISAVDITKYHTDTASFEDQAETE